MLSITPKARKELEQALFQARQRGDLKTVTRILVILAMAAGERQISCLAQLFRVSDEAIRQWLKKYLLGGVIGLVASLRIWFLPSVKQK